jgi:hypothetical protein
VKVTCLRFLPFLKFIFSWTYANFIIINVDSMSV